MNKIVIASPPVMTPDERPLYGNVLRAVDSVVGEGNTRLLLYRGSDHLICFAPAYSGHPITPDHLEEIVGRLREQNIYNSYEGLQLDPKGRLAVDLTGFTDTPVKERPAEQPSAPLEMANYIEIDKYNRYEAGHPGYNEMMNRIVERVVAFAPQGKPARVAEIGAGTGELTRRLGNTLRTQVDAVEIDNSCAGYLHHKIAHSNGEIINAALHAQDFFEFAKNHGGNYDAVTSSFADHHFPPELKTKFLQGIAGILKEGGAYVVGDEFLPPHNEADPAERVKAQMEYHGMIILEAFKEGKVELPKLELDALISGLRTTVPFIQQTDKSSEDSEFRVRRGIKNHYNEAGVAVLSDLITQMDNVTLSKLPNPEKLELSEPEILQARRHVVERLRSLRKELEESRRAGLETDLSQNKVGGDYKMTVRQYVKILKNMHMNAVGYFEGPRAVGNIEEPLDTGGKLDQSAQKLSPEDANAGGVWVLKVQLDNSAAQVASITGSQAIN